MLLEAAAKKWEVSVDELTTEAGIISHQASGKTMGYGEIASEANGITVPEEIALKDPKDFKIIGSDRKNVDGEKIVTGQPLFGIDLQEEGMKIAMIVHPPAFGMKLDSFDGDAIKAMPGISDVFSINTQPEGVKLQWSDQNNVYPELVAIVGETTWQVMKAKKALQVNWVPGSKAESSADHEATLSKFMTEAPKEVARKDGNPAAAFAEAAKVIERTYSAPFLAHNTMEPMNFYANVTADKAALNGPIQTPQFARPTAAALLGMTEDQVSIGMTRMGGGFGRRLYGNFVMEAALISQKAKAPVKLVYTREDDMTQGTYRPAYKVTYRAALDADNKMTAFHVRGAGTHGSPVFADRFPAGAVDNYLVLILSLVQSNAFWMK